MVQLCRCSRGNWKAIYLAGEVSWFFQIKEKSAEVIVVVDTSRWKERRTHEARKD
jgi:hypothetical protein